MSFFEKLGKSVRYAVSETASRTKELASVTKLKTAICAREHELEKYYAAIGRAVFEREAANPESEVAELCTKVMAHRDVIAGMKQQITDLKNEANEERKARSEAIFGDEENPVEEAKEEVTEAIEEVKEEVAEVIEEVKENITEAVEEKAE